MEEFCDCPILSNVDTGRWSWVMRQTVQPSFSMRIIMMMIYFYEDDHDDDLFVWGWSWSWIICKKFMINLVAIWIDKQVLDVYFSNYLNNIQADACRPLGQSLCSDNVGLLGPGWDAGSAANWMFYQLMVYRQCSWHSHPPGWVLHIKRWKNTEMSNKRSGEKGSQNRTDISFYFFQWHLGQLFQSCPFPTFGIFRQYGQ